MTDTSARLLAMLSRLQSRPQWSGTQLADELGVTTRTIRKDVDRLRALGYPVDAVRGRDGYYRLGAGTALPPLLLDDEEAVAIVVGLRQATGLAGVEESSARVLAKLEQVFPPRLRPTLDALSSTITRGPEVTDSVDDVPEIDHAVLSQVATAIRDAEWLRFDYPGDDEPHAVEPYRLVVWQRRWYLVTRSTVTGEWGIYRVDRMSLRAPTRRRFVPRGLDEADYTDFVVREVASSGWSVHARITVLASAEEVLRRINPAVGVVEPIDESRCVLVTGADSVETIAVYVGLLDLEFEVDAPQALVARIRELGARYARAVSPR